MLDRIRHRWEGMSGRGRIFVATPVAFILLYLFHDGLFPLLNWKESLMYAAMECVPVALLAAWATQNELRRRAERDIRHTEATTDESARSSQ